MSDMLQQTDFYQTIKLEEMQSYNNAIVHALTTMNPDDYDKQSHFFHGRYENIYINENKIPALATLIEHIMQEAARYLKVEQSQIKMGFWFNIMKPGDMTTRHCHDDLDEVLSGVYYIRVPQDSGNLLAYTPEPDEILPRESMLVFFLPSLEHEVLRNNSKHIRYSIGFNARLKEGNTEPSAS